MSKTITSDELAEFMDARDKICDFCGSCECNGCIVNELASDAMNSVSDDEGYDDEDEE